MLLSVKRLGANTEPYEVELFLKPPRVADLKEALLENTGIPIWAQRVFHQGRCLISTKTLEEQGVTADGKCTLHLAASAHYKAPPASEAASALPPSQASASSSSMPADASSEVPVWAETAGVYGGQAESPENSGGTASEAVASEEVDLSKLSVAELKQQLRDRGVSYEGCTEKSDLVDLLRECIATGRYDRRRPEPPQPPPGPPGGGPAANGGGPFGGNGGPFEAFAGGVPGAGQPNPLAAFFSQIGPMVGTAMNQAMAQSQARGHQPPPGPGGTAIPVPPVGMPTVGAVPGFVGFPQPGEQQQQQPGAQWASGPGVAAPPPMPLSMAALLQQLGPQFASQMGGAPASGGQSQDFGDITFTTDMSFVMPPQMGAAAAGVAPTTSFLTPESFGTGTQTSAAAGVSPPGGDATDVVE